MTEKLVLKPEKESKATMPIFIDIETHSKLVALKAEKGVPIRKLTDMMLNFALENIVIEGESDAD